MTHEIEDMEKTISELLPTRNEKGDKRAQGCALIIAGSKDMPGAAALCTKAALRSGAGLVTLASPRRIIPILQAKLSEPVFVSLEDSRAGGTNFTKRSPDEIGGIDECDFLKDRHVPELLKSTKYQQAVAIGPGLGQRQKTRTAVRNFVHKMYCRSGHFNTIGQRSLVDFQPVHTLTAILRQQGRVNVNDTLWISIYQIVRNAHKEASKDDEVTILHGVHDKFLVVLKLLASDNAAWYSMILGTGNSVGISLVADYNRNLNIRIVLEVTNDILQVGTASTYQDRQFCYFLHILITLSNIFLQIACKITKISAVSTQNISILTIFQTYPYRNR